MLCYHYELEISGTAQCETTQLTVQSAMYSSRSTALFPCVLSRNN